MIRCLKPVLVTVLASLSVAGPTLASSPPATQKTATTSTTTSTPTKATTQESAPKPGKVAGAATAKPAAAKPASATTTAKAKPSATKPTAASTTALAKPAAAKPPTSAAKPPAAEAPVHADNGQPNSMAVTSLANLMQGNARFIAGTLTHPHEDSGIRTALVSGQHPHAIVLSCSDSRVPPEVIFDQGLGDLFVVRAAGHVLDFATVASVEYAVEHLHAPLILVLGHQGCGAVKTALTTAPEAAGSEDLKHLVAAIRPVVAPFAAQAKSDPLIEKPVRAQVEATLTALMGRSAIVRGHVAKGKLSVIPSVYKLASGEVEMWDAPTETTASGGK